MLAEPRVLLVLRHRPQRLELFLFLDVSLALLFIDANALHLANHPLLVVALGIRLVARVHVVELRVSLRVFDLVLAVHLDLRELPRFVFANLFLFGPSLPLGVHLGFDALALRDGVALLLRDEHWLDHLACSAFVAVGRVAVGLPRGASLLLVGLWRGRALESAPEYGRRVRGGRRAEGIVLGFVRHLLLLLPRGLHRERPRAHLLASPVVLGRQLLLLLRHRSRLSADHHRRGDLPLAGFIPNAPAAAAAAGSADRGLDHHGTSGRASTRGLGERAELLLLGLVVGVSIVARVVGRLPGSVPPDLSLDLGGSLASGLAVAVEPRGVGTLQPDIAVLGHPPAHGPRRTQSCVDGRSPQQGFIYSPSNLRPRQLSLFVSRTRGRRPLRASMMMMCWNCITSFVFNL